MQRRDCRGGGVQSLHSRVLLTAILPINPPGLITQEFLTPKAIRRGIIAGLACNIGPAASLPKYAIFS